MLKLALVALAASSLPAVRSQIPSGPHDYPGKPSGDFSPEWQSYFQVTQPLPNITFDLSRNWAGSISVNRADKPNNTLFFWAFEKENGSLTAAAGERSDEPWGIWLNGGPGSSSMVGLFTENGPIHFNADYSLSPNNYSWDRLADYIWVDQPVGTGYSTAGEKGFVLDEDQMGEDFMGFLSNLVKVFPSLKTRPFYLTGESYAGTYIPYITKHYFGLTDPPVNLRKIAIGDGSIASFTVFEEAPMVQVLETYPQLIGYDPEVLAYFKGQAHLCGYDFNLTYPQKGKFPTLEPEFPEGFTFQYDTRRTMASKSALLAEVHSQMARNWHLDDEKNAGRVARNWHLDEEKAGGNVGRNWRAEGEETEGSVTRREIEARRNEWLAQKRDLTGRGNGTTLDPWYQCEILQEVVDYALNFSLPWSVNHNLNGWDYYNIPDALYPEAPADPSVFLNNPATRAALHAPDKSWTESIPYHFGGPEGSDPSEPPMPAFLDELAVNATNRGVSVVLYSGNDDALVAHFGTEVTIQNTTFGGIQGFTRKPSTPWFDDNGEFAGIVHQERNWTFVLIANAGHLVPQQQPDRAFVLLREFILGNNQTGLVITSDNSASVSVVGGESTTIFANEILPGQDGIYVGSGTTQSTYFYPSATIAAWQSLAATAIPAVNISNGPPGGGSSGGAVMGSVGGVWWGVVAALACATMVSGWAS